MVNITLALGTTRFLDKEHEYMPWQTARGNLGHILVMFERSEVFGPIQVRWTPPLSHLKPGCKSRGHVTGLEEPRRSAGLRF